VRAPAAGLVARSSLEAAVAVAAGGWTGNTVDGHGGIARCMQLLARQTLLVLSKLPRVLDSAILDDIAREVHVPEQRLSQRRHLPKQLLRRPPRFFMSLLYVCPKAVLGN